MSEKINYIANENNFLGWAVIHLMTFASEKSGKDFMQLFNPQANALDVEVKINGVECSFTDLINFMEKAFLHEVEKRAKGMIDDKTADIYESLERLARMAKDKLGG